MGKINICKNCIKIGVHIYARELARRD